MNHAIPEALPQSELYSPDLAPISYSRRTWNGWHLASLWVGMSVCIPTYVVAASMIQSGMTWWQSVVAILFGNLVVLAPMLIIGHAGTRYGIPFPVYARAAFGVHGAHLPTLLRGVVGCGWFGVQAWVGGLAIAALLGVPTWLGFVGFLFMNLYFVHAGTRSIRWLTTITAPFLIVLGLGLPWWAIDGAGGLAPLLAQTDAIARAAPPLRGGFLLGHFLPWVTAVAGFWAPLAISVPDFTRFARSQRHQVFGLAAGSVIGIAMTGVTMILSGQGIWNPAELAGRLTAGADSKLLVGLALLVVLVAILTTNSATNIVAPANALANLSPRRIDYRLGGYIAAFVGVILLPWRLLDAWQTWLLSSSGLLGAVCGVLVCDYLVIRRLTLDLDDLYRANGRYAYRDGFNRKAMIAMMVGVVVSMAGLLTPALAFLFQGAWFTAGISAFMVYYVLMRGER